MDDRPFLSTYKDRHGKTRWRFRRGKVERSIPGAPGDVGFEEAYAAALNGRPSAKISAHPRQALPRTLKAAWRLATSASNLDWKKLGPSSRAVYIARAERLLAMEAKPGAVWGDAPVADLKRRHVKSLLGSMSDTPHAAYDALVVLRKMILVALDEEWIEVDPTHRIKYRPETKGHRAWTDAERAAYEARWPLGTLARTAYACVLYGGPRRSDVARFKWADFAGDHFPHTQQKTGKHLTLPVLPALREALDAAPRLGEHVLTTPSGDAARARHAHQRFPFLDDGSRAGGLHDARAAQDAGQDPRRGRRHHPRADGGAGPRFDPARRAVFARGRPGPHGPLGTRQDPRQAAASSPGCGWRTGWRTFRLTCA